MEPITRIPVRAWPSTIWDPAPSVTGYRWVNYVRGPTSFIWIREEGSNRENRVYLGRPFPIDPKRRYQIRNCGFTADGPISGQAHVVNIVDTTALASAVETGDSSRIIGGETVVLASLAPISGGFLRARFRSTFSVNGTTASVCKISTVGLDSLFLRGINLGSDTATYYGATMPADAAMYYALVGGWYLSGGVALTAAAGQVMMPIAPAYMPSALSAGSNTGIGNAEMAGIVCAVSLTGTGIVVSEFVGRVGEGRAF